MQGFGIAAFFAGFMCFAIPVVAVPAPRGTTVMVVLIALVTLLALLVSHRTRVELASGWWFGITVLTLFAAWGLLSYLWAIDPELSLERATKVALSILSGGLAVLAARLLRPKSRSACRWLLVAGLGVAALLLWFEQLSGAQMAYLLGDDWMNDINNRRLIYNRSLACLIPIAAIAAAAWPAMDRLGRLALTVSIVALGTVTALLESATSIVALAVATVIFASTLAFPSVLRVAIPTILVAAFLTSPLIAPRLDNLAEDITLGKRRELVANEIHMINEAEYRLVHRLLIWGFVGERVADRPILGWGLGASRVIPGGADEFGGRYSREQMRKLPHHPHNGALQIWLELGAVGALLTAVFLGWLGWLAGRTRDRIVLAARMSALCGTIVIASSAYGIWQSWLLAAFALTTGLAVLLSNGEDRLQLTRPENKAP